MRIISNPYRGKGLVKEVELESGPLVIDPSAAMSLMKECPKAHQTPVTVPNSLSQQLGIARLYIKDERSRMGLGSFKALGAAFAIAKQASAQLKANSATEIETALKGKTFVCASAGNHGLSMAAGAKIFGATAVVYLSHTVPENFARKLVDKGATVVRDGNNYEASMAAAQNAAIQNNWQLLSDSSWTGYSDLACDVMEGYLIMGAELETQIHEPPTHVFLQAGVGGLATSATIMCRHLWGSYPKIIIVEPEEAPCLIESIEAGKPVQASGAVSNMGRLDCKEPSHVALGYLAKEADYFMTISDDHAADACDWLLQNNLASTPSGAAGIAGLVVAQRQKLLKDLGPTSRVLTILSEEAANAE